MQKQGGCLEQKHAGSQTHADVHAIALTAVAPMQGDFRGVRCVDAGAFNWYPKHHRPVKLRHDDSEGAKGAIADQEGHKDHKGFQFKVFSLCYVTSFDEVGTAVKYRMTSVHHEC